MSTSWAVIAVELTSDILLKIGQINPIISSSRLRCLKGKHCRLKCLQLQISVCPLASSATEPRTLDVVPWFVGKGSGASAVAFRPMEG